MIEASDIELSFIIKAFVQNIDFDISTQEAAMQTLRKVEKTYWQYCCRIPHHPKQTFSQYFKHVCFLNNVEWNYSKYVSLKTQYNYYKKSIPTAGAMIHYHEEDKIYLLLVRNNRARVFSLPKGKQEKDEDIKDTAIREVLEETGLDISSYINSSQFLSSSDASDIETETNDTQSEEINKYYICKSVIYDVQMHEKIDQFKGYDDEEIVDIRWVTTDDIIANPHLYSRQVKTACQILLDKYF